MFRTNTRNIETKQWISSTKQRIGLLAALMLCVFGAKAQTDYSGIYYIASYGYPDDLCYDPTNIGSNFYLRPAANPVRPNNIDAYWFPINHPEQNDPEKPFLTTNHTGHDMSIAAWAIQKTGDYYYFIHVGTGKYVRYQPCYSGDPSGDARRKAMHLEAFDAAPDNDSCKFVIEVVDDDNAVYAIRPKTLTDGNRYWNVSSGNTTSNNGQVGSLYFNGLIGIYSAKGYSVSGKFSNWKFEPQIPVLSPDEINQQVIVSGLWPNADIRYTLDGSDPTNASTPCTDGIIPIGDARKTVKVRAYYNGFSTVVSTIKVDFRVWNEITDLSQITNMDKRYILIDDIDDASSHVTIDGFTGAFDGNFKTIAGLTQPLFSTLDGGYTSGEEITVCNVILKDVDIVGHEGNTGAIACTAKGNVCIYNCGIIGDSKVGGTGDTGGLVGLLQHYSYSPSEPKYSFARVVNCYSFANIVAAGTYAAGIVGNNNCGSNAQN